jgi:hypothetical protein
MAKRVNATNDLIAVGGLISAGGGVVGALGGLALGIDATLVGLKAHLVDPPPTQTVAMIPLPVPEINWSRQELHFPGWKNYVVGKGQLTANPEELALRAGTGTPVNNVPRGTPGFRERVDFGKVIGQYIDPASDAAVPTTKGIILMRPMVYI